MIFFSFLYLLSCRKADLILRSFSERVVPNAVVVFGVSVGRGELRIFLLILISGMQSFFYMLSIDLESLPSYSNGCLQMLTLFVILKRICPVFDC